MCLAAISRIVEHFHTGAFRIGLATGKDECVRANQIASFIARRRRRLIACLPPPSKGAGNQSKFQHMEHDPRVCYHHCHEYLGGG